MATGDIKLSANFQANVAKPLDSKFTVADETARDALTFVYTGLLCYLEAEDRFDYWDGSQWVEGFGSGGGVSSIIAGDGISVDTPTGDVTVTNSDSGTVAVTVHEGEIDPHPQYNTKVPTGGTEGQVLTKDTSTDYDVSWQDAPVSETYLWPGTGAPSEISATRVEWIGAITSSSGQITFNVTEDGTATGTPIFDNLNACGFSLATVRDTDANNESPWAHIRSTANNKTVLVQVKKSNTGPVVLLGSYYGNLNNTNPVTTYLRIVGEKYVP